MPDDISITTVIVSSFVGGLVSYAGAVIKNTLDTRTRINDALREKRTEKYKMVWGKTQLLPRWPRNPNVTYEQLYELSEGLRDWYFEGGGIYLTRETQKVYASLQEVIAEITTSKEKNRDVITNDEHDVNNEYDTARKACSTLRTSMTEDLLSRRGAPELEFISSIVNRVKNKK